MHNVDDMVVTTKWHARAKTLRAKSGLKLSDVSKLTGFDTSTLSRIERHGVGSMSALITYVEALGKLTNTDLTWMFSEINKKGSLPVSSRRNDSRIELSLSEEFAQTLYDNIQDLDNRPPGLEKLKMMLEGSGLTPKVAWESSVAPVAIDVTIAISKVTGEISVVKDCKPGLLHESVKIYTLRGDSHLYIRAKFTDKSILDTAKVASDRMVGLLAKILGSYRKQIKVSTGVVNNFDTLVSRYKEDILNLLKEMVLRY